ncbi:hypothetical protein RY972_06185 [Aeromonas allosaccharophila]|uniref:Uncharacterized protein n=1 Tax=Aeromonas allosaccharophila TaxID=656 RepID=A0ABZ0FDQ0_9GAMM|nr:hypothetical protein [Aeromonas allosaccharophila]MCS0540550.1 hypothetical protein [Aeromonas veronii]WOE67652.1 hypothetical protein RY972_06185 [Aeromonas allosaccharophila]
MKKKSSDVNVTNLYDFENILTRFKRAKCEETLDLMYNGAIKKANESLSGKTLFNAHIAIERALDQCQQTFDKSQVGLNRKVNFILKEAEDLSKKYNPEDELRRLLSSII